MSAVAQGMAAGSSSYPFGLEVRPPAPQNRLSVLLRIIYAIPHVIVLYLLNIAVQVVGLIAWFAILFTGKYPQGLLSFAVGALRWQTRASAYMYLLTDAYPPFSLDELDYPARLVGEGQVEGRNRLTTFFRIILAIPHAIVLAVLGMVLGVIVFIAWIAALVTGSVPEGMHNFMVGVLRWSTRFSAYVQLLCDEYPPFSMS